MNRSQNQRHYRIYLLTMWAEQTKNAETSTTWRFGLEDPKSGRRRGFANLVALITALHEEIAGTEDGQIEGGDE